MSSDSVMPTEDEMRAAIVARLNKWPLTDAATPTALVYLHERGELTRVVNAALPAVKSSAKQGLDRNRIDEILSQVFAAQNMRMLASASDSPAFKLLREREIFEAMSDKVVQQSIGVAVDDGPRGTWPGEILVKAIKQLCKESGEPGAEELTSHRIDRTLEDIVINDAWGSFYWGSDGKRHLRLNSPEWREARAKKVSPPSKIGYTIGDLTGVYPP